MAFDYAKAYQQFIDEELAASSATAWMIPEAGKVRFTGGRDIEISTLSMDRGAGGGCAGYPHENGPARHHVGRGHRRVRHHGDDLRGGQTVFMKKDLLLVWERVLVLCSGEGKMHVLLLGSGSQGGALFFRYRGSIGSKRPEIRIPEV